MHLVQQDCNRLPADKKGGLLLPVCTSAGKGHSFVSAFAAACVELIQMLEFYLCLRPREKLFHTSTCGPHAAFRRL
jgi:ribosomal protein S12 methylthiotransferase accessory factor YcaO